MHIYAYQQSAKKTVTIRNVVIRFIQSLEIYPTIFQTWKKYWKNLESFFRKLQEQFFSCWPNLVYLHSYGILENAFFPHFLKVSVDHPFDNCEYGKRNYCCGKSLEKGLAFWIQKSV